ncbi:putative 3-hydroxyacid dehydrogenase [Synechococcus sp. WH 8109]|uniref:NAD(P)-dependent oxidoreductase n=1 Tax=Synechococcus sp. WH 8109 TaxID=166314 RepID=UPI0001B8DC04|nr:NAD(P)-dependent oxidoreductase [Synechococcus sp. WH 8109]AHF64970.1 putative 3-hydroxyacid dehydrogenase [Synechococcus sp. WH 8109]
MTSVAVLGTGLLGTAIATRLLEQGLNVHVWNRDPSRIVSLVGKGATAIDDLGQAAKSDSVLITVLRDGAATASVIGAVGALPGSTVIPMGTMGVEESRKLATQVANQGGQYLEAPVLGSKPQALNGSLLVMAGGEAEVFEEQRPLLSHLCQEPQLVGPVGCGAATKLALNQLIASLTHSFSLSLQLIQRAGVPVETFMTILRPSALYAPTFDKKLQRMLDHSYADPNFSTALLRKDLRLFLEEATTAGLQDQGLSGLLSLLEQAKGTELDEQDYCALHELTVLR